MSLDGVLFLHLVGVLLFVGGSITASVLRLAALRREKPSEIALLLQAVRPVVPLVGGGLLLAVAAGFWLTSRLHVDLGAKWLVVTYALLVWLGVVGAVAGRQDRQTRELAERLAEEGDTPSAELARRLRDPLNLVLNGTMLLAVAAIVAMMVWKPAG
jgi:uncharacterized membrane protein